MCRQPPPERQSWTDLLPGGHCWLSPPWNLGLERLKHTRHKQSKHWINTEYISCVAQTRQDNRTFVRKQVSIYYIYIHIYNTKLRLMPDNVFKWFTVIVYPCNAVLHPSHSLPSWVTLETAVIRHQAGWSPPSWAHQHPWLLLPQ